VRDLERVVRKPVDPLRFRANLYIDDAPPWEELSWAGRGVRIGSADLRVDRPIGRCAATNVDPQTAERDLNIPRTLQAGFGHTHMGVYATVTAAGDVAQGDELRPAD